LSRTKSKIAMFKIFESEEEKMVKSHIRHLVRLANADGVFHKKEKKFIMRIGLENGLSARQVEKIIEKPMAVDINIPESKVKRFYQVFDLVNLITKDGQVTDAETEFCQQLANRLGFRKVIVGILVAKIERGIAEGLSRKELRKECQPFINY